jgi:protein gp37
VPNYSSIEWTEYSWNPVTGCSKVSSGCINCYAERLAKRFKAMGSHRYKAGFDVRTHPNLLSVPYRLKRPHLIFVNSMSDLFHEEIPEQFIKEVFKVMNNCPQHTFQILTKRSQRMLWLSQKLNWSNNIWMGVTIEDQNNSFRIDELRETSARIKFISCEPLLGPVYFSRLDDINWVIVGGESGPNARPMKKEWAISLRDQCLRARVAFFFKQWGGKNRKAAGRLLEGKIWDQIPVSP